MQGSKSRIADKIIDLLPSATHFYDLFGGGTRAARVYLRVLDARGPILLYRGVRPRVYVLGDKQLHARGGEGVSTEQMERS